MSRKCLTDDLLREHLEGRLHASQEVQVVAHLDGCQRCQATLDGLAADTQILEIARLSARNTETADPTLDQLLQELGQLHSAALDDAGSVGELEQLRQVGHYTVLGVAGRGGMGVALKARDEKLGRLACLKFFAGPAAVIETARVRWLREARAAAAIHSEHVVQIYTVDEYNGRPFLAMEYVAGRTLQEEIDLRGPLPIEEVREIARQIAIGLGAAHARGLVHRDVKPGNLLLQDDTGLVKIADFGLARTGDDSRLTSEGCVAGTPEYMAPEQILNKPVDHRADLFSLGGVMYTMCSGESPFAAANSLAVVRRVADDMPVPVRRLRKDVPPLLARLIERLLEKQPARRPQSAQEVIEALSQIDLPSSATLSVSRRAVLFAAGASLAGAASIVGFIGIGHSTSEDINRVLDNRPKSRRALVSLPPGRSRRVLFVVTPRDFYGLYYIGVRRQLDLRNVKCHVASINTHECVSSRKVPTVTVKPDLMINYTWATNYDLIYFVGGDGCNIYANGGSHQLQAKQLIDDALDARCVIAAMGMASVVLAEAGVLKGRRATGTRYGSPPGSYIERLTAAGVKWVDAPVVQDGPFLTGRDPQDVQEFIYAMMERLSVLPKEDGLPPPAD
jgi:serine/threonine protein kinase